MPFENLEQLREALPVYAKDTKLNLGSVVGTLGQDDVNRAFPDLVVQGHAISQQELNAFCPLIGAVLPPSEFAKVDLNGDGNLDVLRRYVKDSGALVLITQLVVAVLAIGSIYLFFRGFSFRDTWWDSEELVFTAGGVSFWGWGVYIFVRASRRSRRQPRSLSRYIQFLCVALFVVLFFAVFAYAARAAEYSMGIAMGGLFLGGLSLVGWVVNIGTWVLLKNTEAGRRTYKALRLLVLCAAVAIVLLVFLGPGRLWAR